LLLMCGVGGVLEEMKSVSVAMRESGIAACSTHHVGASLSHSS
jgi:hypothetical protein